MYVINQRFKIYSYTDERPYRPSVFLFPEELVKL